MRAASSTAADAFPEGFVSERIFAFDRLYPTAMAFGAEGRIFVAFKDGVVQLYRPGAAPSTFIDLSAEVNQSSDRGLLGMALHPQFPEKPYLYLLYVHDPPELTGAPLSDGGPDGRGARVSRLVRVTADAAHDYDRALPGSAVVLLGRNSTFAAIGNPNGRTGPPSCNVGEGSADSPGTPMEDCIPADGSSHSIGTLRFGNDGSLFAGNGDSSRWEEVDPRALRALDRDSLAGKILRIDPETGEGLPDNPFFTGDATQNRSRVWSYGLRNPFRFAIHPETNEPFIGDAGWETWEELNTGRGANFGWPCYEGNDEGSLRQPAFEHNARTAAACAELYALGATEVTAPIHSYPRAGVNSAIIAGDFYMGTSYPEEYRGALFLADFNRQEMSVARIEDQRVVSVTPFASGTGSVVQILTGPDSNLYYLLLGERNELRRLRWIGGGNQPPQAKVAATPVEGDEPLLVNLSSSGSFDPDGDALTFAWDLGDGTTSSLPEVSHLYSLKGAYRVTLTVTDPGGASSSDSILIIVGDTAPEAEILLPDTAELYTIGEAIAFEGRGFDHQDGELAGERLAWEVVLHHAEHIHPNVHAAIGRTGQFVVEDHGDDTWLELILVATDSGGFQDSTSIAIHPQTVERHFVTDPPGLDLIYYGSRLPAPFIVMPVVGASREIHAPAIQQHMSFAGWSDGGAASHSITISDAPVATLTARYVNHPPVANIAATPRRGPFPLRVTLSAAGSSDAEDEDLTYEWDFGDGSATAAGRNVQHVFAEEGVYRIVLTVRDQLGSASTAAVWIGNPVRRRSVRN